MAVVWSTLLVGVLGVGFVVWAAMREPGSVRRRRATVESAIVRYLPIAAPGREFLAAEGWPADLLDAMADGPHDVTVTSYANGSTQVWLKRRPA